MGRHLSIDAAALVLGVSSKTVRRRLKSGRLSGRLVDGRWVVDLPDEVVDQEVSTLGTHDQDMSSAGETIAALRAELAAVQAERDRLWQQLGEVTAVNGRLAATVYQLTELKSLPSAASKPSSKGWSWMWPFRRR